MSLCRRAAEGVSPYGGRVWFALVLQPAVEDIRFVFKAPSTRVPARVAASKKDRMREEWDLQPAYPRVLQPPKK